MKKHTLFGLILPIASLICLMGISFPFIDLKESISFSLESKIIIAVFLVLTIGFLAIDSINIKKSRLSLLISLLPLLILNNSFSYSFIYVISFFYCFYLIVIYKKEPNKFLTYGLYNKLSYNIYLIVLSLLGITLSVYFISVRLFYYLFLSLGLAFLLILGYNIFYDKKLTKAKKETIDSLRVSKDLLAIYEKYANNINEETKSTILLYLSLGYLLEGSYLEGAKAFDSVNNIKTFDMSLYYLLKLSYDYLLNKNFNKSLKILNSYENFVKKIKSKQKRNYYFTRFDKINELFLILANKKNKHEAYKKYEGLDKLYEYMINTKLKLKQEANEAYEKSGLYLLFF